MKVCVIETDHGISQTVCRRIADHGFDLFNVRNAPNLFRYDAVVAYGILRGTPELMRSHPHWFEIDKGLTDAEHYDGQYRLSYRATQPIYGKYSSPPTQAYNGEILPWKDSGHTLICPPTQHVCEFFGLGRQINYALSVLSSEDVNPNECRIRQKGDDSAIEWDKIGKLVTFNSSLGFEALKRGIPVISDPLHSTIGSFTKNIGKTCGYDRLPLFEFAGGHQFKLSDGAKLWQIIKNYISTSGMIQERPLQHRFSSTRYGAGPQPD